MAPKDNNVVTSREMMRDLHNMLADHIKDSNDFRRKSEVQLASIETHLTYTRDKLVNHTNQLEELQTSRKEQKGAIKVIGFLGLTSLILWFRHFIANL